MKKIVINTGGGDAPGLNAVIRAIVLSAMNRGWEVYGSRFGYRGLLESDHLVHLDRVAVRGITHLGGTILGTTNRGDPFSYPVKTKNSVTLEDLSGQVVEKFHKYGFMERELQGRRFSIVVVAEGAKSMGGDLTTTTDTLEPGRQEVRLGGIASKVTDQIREITGKDCRSIVLGHLQRGGSPTTFDRLLSLRFGTAAVRFVEKERFGYMVAINSMDIKAVPIKDAVEGTKFVPLDCNTMDAARDLGISFGD
jgi:6-phosphofructokinase